MTSFSPFIRKTSPEMRKALADRLGLSMPDDVNWTDPGLKFASLMTSVIDETQAHDRTEVVSALERITSLADEVGDRAMDSVWPEELSTPELAGVQDRAIWLFINDPPGFQRAEEARFIDSLRRTRRFDGFVLASGLRVLRSEESQAAFISAYRAAVSDGRVHVDVFERTRRGFDDTEYKVVQITVYAEQKLEVSLEFRDEQVMSVSRRPVLSAALTYEPATGTVEVAGNARNVRDALVKGFAAHLLDAETSVAALRPRRFDLQHLRQPHAFPTDASDRIEAVKLRSLRLMPLGFEDERLTIEIGKRASPTVWDVAEMRFGENNPLRGGWLITSAVISVTFRPTGSAKRGKTITLQITEPNGCDLKDRTELEQMIGNKYLRRWDILSDEPDLIDD